MQGYAAVLSSATPIVAVGGAATTVLQVLAPMTITWSDSTTDSIAAGTAILTLETGASVIDATANIWLVVTVKGVGLSLAKESDYGNLDTLTSSGTWAVLYRLQVGRIDSVQQV